MTDGCHAQSSAPPKPPWIKVRLPSGQNCADVKALLSSKTLHTVCEAALCPNMAECWARGTATFLILGDVCTRSCGFCAIKTGRPRSPELDTEEPARVAAAVAAMKLRHAVITSVTRDDLPDGGARLFAETVRAVRRASPECTVELLIPDFQGDPAALAMVVESRSEILGHNMETVSARYPRVRPQANYQRSLEVLHSAKTMAPGILTKSGIMVGVGETWDELLEMMADLRAAGCDILTIGQYLRPSRRHLPVIRYYHPDEFEALRQEAHNAGFRRVEAGPLVRSSYHAEEQGLTTGPRK